MHKYAAPAAAACIRGDSRHPGLRGRVAFSCHPDGVQVVAEIMGLPESDSGFFALHIHENGDCGGDGFPGTGAHFNPTNQPHPRHAGDLPPLLSRAGRADLAVVTDRFEIGQLIGRSVVIHSGPDDFRTQPSGDSGTKIACGVIRKT